MYKCIQIKPKNPDKRKKQKKIYNPLGYYILYYYYIYIYTCIQHVFPSLMLAKF